MVVRRRSEEHTSELQSRQYLVCRLLLEKKKKKHGAAAATQSACVYRRPSDLVAPACVLMVPRPPSSTLFPYTTLFRSSWSARRGRRRPTGRRTGFRPPAPSPACGRARRRSPAAAPLKWWCGEDRKSTRLNSSHANISYAVFCLKKKKKSTVPRRPRSPPASTAAHLISLHPLVF